jgi:hypothetical protein
MLILFLLKIGEDIEPSMVSEKSSNTHIIDYHVSKLAAPLDPLTSIMGSKQSPSFLHFTTIDWRAPKHFPRHAGL